MERLCGLSIGQDTSLTDSLAGRSLEAVWMTGLTLAPATTCCLVPRPRGVWGGGGVGEERGGDDGVFVPGFMLTRTAG